MSEMTDTVSEQDKTPQKGDDEKPMSGAALLKEIIVTVAIALGIALTLRTFLFQPFHIPSGSMEPTLIQGDYIITSKYSVGYGKYAASPLPFPNGKSRVFEREPERGDILVFRPVGNKNNFIKRVIGLPGDRIQMIKGVLHINSTAVGMVKGDKTTQYGNGVPALSWVETLPNGVTHDILDETNSMADNTSVFTVPQGYYFMMGDNRDNSSDSRASVGYVPASHIIGKAEFILASGKRNFSIVKPWTWFNLHGDRFFKGLE